MGRSKILLFVYVSIACSVLFFIIGCESIQEDDQDHLTLEPHYHEPMKPSSFDELQSTVGDSHAEAPFEGDFPLQINKHIEDLGYEEPTGKWSMANGEGQFGYTIPHGSMEAGEHSKLDSFMQPNRAIERNGQYAYS